MDLRKELIGTKIRLSHDKKQKLIVDETKYSFIIIDGEKKRRLLKKGKFFEFEIGIEKRKYKLFNKLF